MPLKCVMNESQSKLDNHELHQSPDSLSLCDSSCHQLYPLTYASEHKQSFDFSQIPPKVHPTATIPQPPPCIERWQWQQTPPCRPSSLLTQSEKAHSHLYLQGSCFFFKEQHDQHYGIWKTPLWLGRVNQSQSWRLTNWEKSTLTPTARLEAHKNFKCILPCCCHQSFLLSHSSASVTTSFKSTCIEYFLDKIYNNRMSLDSVLIVCEGHIGPCTTPFLQLRHNQFENPLASFKIYRNG